ncbi:MAG: N-acetylmuramic acid 6-phosphate etherase [Candidatus Bathyarchaeia archaeon]
MENLVTEQRNPASTDIDRKPTEEILKIINAEDKKVAYAVEKEIPKIAEAVDLIVDSIKKGGRLFFIGAGTSGRLGVMEAAEMPPTFGVNPELVQGIIAGGIEALYRSLEGVEDDRNAGVKDLLSRGFASKDVLVGISASGKTPYTVAALEFAKKMGAKTIGITCNLNSEIAKIADVTIEVIVGPEVITGSTRMKAGTAQKMVLNMLTTAIMVKLGKVYENLMVDLKAANEKLRERAKRIIMSATNVSYDEAEKAINAAQGNVKAAILMIKTKVSYEEALRLLEKSGGILRKAIEEQEAKTL